MLVSLKPYLAVMAGASTGGACPYGTQAVIPSGCSVTGFAAALLATHVPDSQLVGSFPFASVAGGYTTFSSFSDETMRFAEEDEAGVRILYAAASLAGRLAFLRTPA